MRSVSAFVKPATAATAITENVATAAGDARPAPRAAGRRRGRAAPGTSSANRSRKKPGPWASAGRSGRYSFAASNEVENTTVQPLRHQLWVTLTAANELVELPADARPHALRRFATVRQPNGVAIDSSTGRVFVTGRADSVLQAIDGR